MSVRKIKYNDEFIYIDDEVDEKETGIIISGQEDTVQEEKTEDFLDNTSTDIFGDDNE